MYAKDNSRGLISELRRLVKARSIQAVLLQGHWLRMYILRPLHERF